MRFVYPYELTPEDEGGFSISVPDVRGVHTQAENEVEAAQQAEDALISMLSALVDDGKRIPGPSAPRGRPVVRLHALDAAKLARHEAMLDAGVGVGELAGRLGKDEKLVRRLRDP
ncbi:MAG: type II toxin-antitoxin system HicB family antitoxin, partial [Acetobacteraceae bacterium]